LRSAGAARAVALTAALGLVASACGESPSPLERTADNLGDIRSGTLSLRFSLTPATAERGIGVALRGPFSLAGKGPLPVARIAYSERAGVTRRATFISTGDRAFVETAGRTVRLPASSLRGLRLGSGPERSLEDLGLHVERWVKNTRTTAGPRLEGKSTELISGTLDAEAALDDLAPLLGEAGGLSKEESQRLSRTVSASAVRIVTGSADHLLRRLRLSVTLAVPPDLRAKVGGRHALRIKIGLKLSRLNRPVRVRHPGAS
jgi:hypothetical protein